MILVQPQQIENDNWWLYKPELSNDPQSLSAQLNELTSTPNLFIKYFTQMKNERILYPNFFLHFLHENSTYDAVTWPLCTCASRFETMFSIPWRDLPFPEEFYYPDKPELKAKNLKYVNHSTRKYIEAAPWIPLYVAAEKLYCVHVTEINVFANLSYLYQWLISLNTSPYIEKVIECRSRSR